MWKKLWLHLAQCLEPTDLNLRCLWKVFTVSLLSHPYTWEDAGIAGTGPLISGERRESSQKRAAPVAQGPSLPPCTASSGAGWERWAVFRTWSTKVTLACSYICDSECSPFFRIANLLCEIHAVWVSKNRSQHHTTSLYYSISSLFPSYTIWTTVQRSILHWENSIPLQDRRSASPAGQ